MSSNKSFDGEKGELAVEVKSVHEQNTIEDAVFGEITEKGPNYRNVSRATRAPLTQRSGGWAP